MQPVGNNAASTQFLAEALDVAQAQEKLRGCVDGSLQVEAARLVRHKPGRRFLVEYDVVDGANRRQTWIGKSRVKGLDRHTFELHRALHAGAFADESADQIGVPAPVGIVPQWHMWLQRKIRGMVLTEQLWKQEAPRLCGRAIEAVNKLHGANVAPRKAHNIGDELEILEERLSGLADAQPRFAAAIGEVLARCRSWAARIPPARQVGIHRDFYPDQVIVGEDSRFYLIDLDLYCLGDAALDIGNFLAHISELALRQGGSAEALGACEEAATDTFLRLNPSVSLDVVNCWKKLALARHIHISAQFADRQPFTEAIIERVLRRER